MLHDGWIGADIGHPTPGGQATSDEAVTVFGGGVDIYGRHDSFRFASRILQSVDQLQATVSLPLDTNEYAKAGLMLRCGDQDDAAFVMINVFPDKTIGLCARTRRGDAATEIKHYPGLKSDTPAMKLTVRGRAVEAFFRTDVNAWESVGIVELPEIPKDARIGYATCSHDGEYLTKATFTSFHDAGR